jgi:hypothetical protein
LIANPPAVIEPDFFGGLTFSGAVSVVRLMVGSFISS